jgi:aminopeptidase N
MSHPIRPDKYIEINNFYTMTVYQKGAEIIRMYHTLLGEGGFRKGLELYIARHDHEAVTCDDFLAAMADANGRDLQRFSRWYSQSGTPEISASGAWDPEARAYTLRLAQRTPPTPTQVDKKPLLIPVAMGLLTPAGREVPLQLDGEPAPTGHSRVLLLEEAEQAWRFVDVDTPPVPSLLRGFSAPVKLSFPYGADDLALLMTHDTDAFVRWEAAQLLAQREILVNVERHTAGATLEVGRRLSQAYRELLTDRSADPALVAEALALPDEEYLAEQMAVIDVDGIHAARDFVRAALAGDLERELRECYAALASSGLRQIARRHGAAQPVICACPT